MRLCRVFEKYVALAWHLVITNFTSRGKLGCMKLEFQIPKFTPESAYCGTVCFYACYPSQIWSLYLLSTNSPPGYDSCKTEIRLSRFQTETLPRVIQNSILQSHRSLQSHAVVITHHWTGP